MEYICEHIKKLRRPYNMDNLNYEVMEQGYEMDMNINDMRKILNKKIGKTIKNVKVYPDNWCMQRATLISFKYKNLYCEIGEHFGTQRDYLWVKIIPIN